MNIRHRLELFNRHLNKYLISNFFKLYNMEVITITGSNSTTGKLDVSDNGKTFAPANDKIKWLLANGCGVDSITSMSKKPSPPEDPSVDIWSEPPHQIGGSKNWTATIKSSARPGDEWNYYIYWKAKNGEIPPPFDPKIIVNTKIK